MMSTEPQSETLTENPPPVDAPESVEARASLTPAEEAEPAPDAPAPSEPKEEQGAASPCYDSEARQRLPVTLWQDDGRCDVTLVCEPLIDVTMANYVRMVTEANAAESFEDEAAGERIGELNAAGCWLFDVLMSGVEGFGEEGEEAPPDWRDLLFGPLEKVDIINRGVFGVETVPPPPERKAKRRSWAAQSRAVTTRLRVSFGGRMIPVSHTLRRPDAHRFGEFALLHAQLLGLGKPDENLEKLVAGYDALHTAHEGYKGPVPKHHKAAAYVAHMTRQGASIRAK
jgi:hypothetical protein